MTYLILCRRGLQKNECPIIAQGNHCVECNLAYYIPREPRPKEEKIKEELKEENDV